MKEFPASLLFLVGFATFSWVLALPHDVVREDSGNFILGLDRHPSLPFLNSFRIRSFIIYSFSFGCDFFCFLCEFD